MDSQTPELRTERLTVAVTPREKLAAQLVAAAQGTDVSGLLRDRVIAVLNDEAAELRQRLSDLAPTG